MKAYLINMHLLVPRSRSSAKVKVKYKGYISQKMAVLGAFLFHKYILFLNVMIFHPVKELPMIFYTPVKDGTYYGITRGGRAASSSLSGAYLQNYST